MILAELKCKFNFLANMQTISERMANTIHTKITYTSYHSNTHIYQVARLVSVYLIIERSASVLHSTES